MCRIDRLLVLTAIMLLTTLVFAQGTTSQATATCYFNVNDQVAVEYQRFSVNSKKTVFGHEIPTTKSGRRAENP